MGTLSTLGTMVLIMVCCVILVDHLNVFEDFLFKPLWRLGTKMPYNGWGFKPFSCSLCMTWWSCLIFLLLTGGLSIPNITLALLVSWSGFIANDVLVLIKESWAKLMSIIIKKLN